MTAPDLIPRAAVLAALRRPRDGCMCAEKNAIQIRAIPADPVAAAAVALAEALAALATDCAEMIGRVDLQCDCSECAAFVGPFNAYRAAVAAAVEPRP